MACLPPLLLSADAVGFVVENRPTPDALGADAVALELPNVLVPKTGSEDCWPKLACACAGPAPAENEPKPELVVPPKMPFVVSPVGKALGELENFDSPFPKPNGVDIDPCAAINAVAPNRP